MKQFRRKFQRTLMVLFYGSVSLFFLGLALNFDLLGFPLPFVFLLVGVSHFTTSLTDVIRNGQKAKLFNHFIYSLVAFWLWFMMSVIFIRHGFDRGYIVGLIPSIFVSHYYWRVIFNWPRAWLLKWLGVLPSGVGIEDFEW